MPKELTMHNGEVVDAESGEDAEIVIHHGRVYSDRELTPDECEQVDEHLSNGSDA